MSQLGTTEKPENCNGLDLTAGVRRRERPYNGTFVQRVVVTAMAVESVPIGFAISILKLNKVAPSGGSMRKKSVEPQTQVEKQGTQDSSAALPETPAGQRSAPFRLPMIKA